MTTADLSALVGADARKARFCDALSAIVRETKRAPIFVLKMILFLSLLVAPFAAMLTMSPWVAAFGALAIVCNVAVAMHAARRSELGILKGLLAPFVGTGVMIWALFMSAFACWRDGGIRWRGTLYAIADLRAGQRVKLW